MAFKAELEDPYDEERATSETEQFLPSSGTPVKQSRLNVSSNRTVVSWLVNIATYICVAWLAILIYEGLVRQRFVHDQTINLLPGRDVVPYLPHDTLIRFQPNESFYGAAASSAWDELNAKGGGWIAVDHAEGLDLGPPIRYNNKQGYGISVFHQLHCMSEMHRSYVLLLDGNTAGAAAKAYHIEHCFDYIRQVLMCHADLGLEHRLDSAAAGPEKDQVDGWGALHQCRNWRSVVDFVEENRLTKGWKAPPGFPSHHHHATAET